MKKNSFMQGAFIATFAIIISKIIGILYVIPFFPLIGEKGGALYGYAYAIYGLFLNLSTAGIPFAISRITSEYSSLNHNYLKEKSYFIGKLFICGLGLIAFILLFFFSKDIAFLFIGNIKGGNSIEDVSTVIKIISTALLIVPLLSVLRGYLQGHKYIAPSSYSQVIEQITRVAFLLIGSYLTIKVFKLSLTTAVGFSVFAATFGALCAYLYLFLKIHKDRKNLNRDALVTEEEKKVSNMDILKKILKFSIPFILIDVVRNGYNFVDLVTINKTFVGLGYTISQAESVIGILATWGMKLNSMVYAISTGVVISLIPAITSSFVLGNKEDVKRKINKALQYLTFVILPITIGLAMLATPVWTVFFGSGSELGPMVFSFSIYSALIVALFNVTVSVLNSLSYSKTVIISLLIGLVVKAVLNVPLMHAFAKLGIFPSYGVSLATLLGFVACFIVNLYFIKKFMNIDYKETIKNIGKTIFCAAMMIIIILILELFVKVENSGRIMSLLICILYGVVGAASYIYVSVKTGVIYEIFGEDIFKKIFNKLKLKKAKI